MKPPTILLCATLVAACANQVPRSEPAADPLATARLLLAADPVADLDGALLRLDGLATACRDFAPYHALRGELTLKLAGQTRDAGGKGAQFLFLDATAALEKAVALDSTRAAPRLLLAQAQYASNQLEAATTTATALLRDIPLQGEDLAAVHVLRANAAARAHASNMAQGESDPALLTAARTSWRALEQAGWLDAKLLSLWSVTEQRAGAPAEAVDVYRRAVHKQPEDQGLLQALVDTAAQCQQLPMALDALQARRDATGLWYQGRVRYLMAEDEREHGLPTEALAALDAAGQCFATSMQDNPTYRDSCEQWLAMCLGKKGNIAFSVGDLPNAEAWLLAAIRQRPDLRDEDLGQGESIKLGLLRVGDKLMRNFAKAEALYRAASAAADADLDLLNNAGVFARDRGNQLERAGQNEAAAELYERSYAAYRRAVQLDPQNVRLRNDCALVAIHHLARDWDLSRQLLDGAIVDGERALRDDPPAPARARQDLDEAIGDCYENLALWHLVHGKDAVAASAAATKSLEHFPGQKRAGAQRHLQAAERLRHDG